MGVPESVDATPDPENTRLTGSEAVKLHLTLAGGLILCTGAFMFEVQRALGGNELSWAYVFEWPLFAVFACYMWWNLLHQKRGRKRSDGPKVVAPEHVGMLKAWQQQQRTLAAAEADAQRAEPESGSAPASSPVPPCQAPEPGTVGGARETAEVEPTINHVTPSDPLIHRQDSDGGVLPSNQERW